MRTSFPDASVTGHETLIDGMRNDPKDRHVLAAAVRGNAEVIVTFNLRDSATSTSNRSTSSPSTRTPSSSTSWIFTQA
jgi:predicted nucleic acid-binding protein